MDDKKSRKQVSSGRPNLLRRSTASGTSGSVKRRSFRSKKGGNKEAAKDSSDSRKSNSKDSSSDSKKCGSKSSDSRKSDAGSHREKKGSRDDDRKSPISYTYYKDEYPTYSSRYFEYSMMLAPRCQIPYDVLTRYNRNARRVRSPIEVIRPNCVRAAEKSLPA